MDIEKSSNFLGLYLLAELQIKSSRGRVRQRLHLQITRYYITGRTDPHLMNTT